MWPCVILLDLDFLKKTTKKKPKKKQKKQVEDIGGTDLILLEIEMVYIEQGVTILYGTKLTPNSIQKRQFDKLFDIIFSSKHV